MYCFLFLFTPVNRWRIPSDGTQCHRVARDLRNIVRTLEVTLGSHGRSGRNEVSETNIWVAPVLTHKFEEFKLSRALEREPGVPRATGLPLSRSSRAANGTHIAGRSSSSSPSEYLGLVYHVRASQSKRVDRSLLSYGAMRPLDSRRRFYFRRSVD